MGNRYENKGCIRFLRDSAGIAGYIDVSKIFRYYIKICFSSYTDVINSQMGFIFKEHELMNATLDFIKALVTNK
jgi:hypothetical protein